MHKKLVCLFWGDHMINYTEDEGENRNYIRQIRHK